MSERYAPGYLKSNIIEGKSTKKDVLEKLGKPKDKEFNSSGEENWFYNKEDSSARGMVDKVVGLAGRVGGYVPGGAGSRALAPVESVNNQVGMAGNTVETAQEVGGKELYTRLYVYFDENGVVRHWNLDK